MNARLFNTSLRAAVALLGALALASGVAACGSSGPSGQTLVNETFSSHMPVESGQLDLLLAFTPTGSGASPSKALSLHVTGPFQSVGAEKLPHFAFQLGLTLGGQPVQAGVTSAESKFFVQLGGNWFEAPASTYKQIEEGYAQAAKRNKSGSSFSALGIEPRKWLVKPSNDGTTTVAGEPVYHVSADVDTNVFLQDVSKLSQSTGSLGATVPGVGSLTPSAISELGHAIHNAHVDIYTGKSDHVLRRLELTATVSSTSQTQALLNGAGEADVKLQLQFAELNKPQTIAAPSHARPFSELLPTLQQLLGQLQGSSSGSSLGG